MYGNLPYQAKSYIKGILLVGQRLSGTIGILYKSNNTSNFSLENVEIESFDIGERYEENSYIIKHTGCSIGRCNIGTQMPSGFTNYGENISFVNSSIANCGICIQNMNADGNFHLSNCSLDYSTLLVDAQNGGVFLNMCHMETNNENQNITDAIFKTGDTQTAYIHIIGGTLIYWRKPSNITSCFHTLFTKENTSIYVNGTRFFNVTGFTEALCSGTGKIKLENIKQPTEGDMGFSGIVSVNNNLLNKDFYNNFFEVDITKYTGSKTNNITTDNVSISKHENGMKIVKTTAGSDGTINIFVPIKECVCTYSMKITDIGGSNNGTVYLQSLYSKLIFDENGYIKKGISTEIGVTNITPVGLSNEVFVNPKKGEKAPSWATHFVLTFNTHAYKGTFKIHDLVINAI